MTRKKRVLAGFAAFIVPGLVAYALSGNVTIGLAVAIIVLLCLPPSLDPAIQIKQDWYESDFDQGLTAPPCFGGYPFNAGLCAERGCADCPVGQACLKMSRELYRKD